ncbi:MAG: DUF948 domain-containing protein [Gammaproteobacteria bacterium]|nr:DUF948 domain-containing protein [Gammaproteobacteria bacterium]
MTQPASGEPTATPADQFTDTTPLRRHNLFDESGRHIERIATVFESSAKRWELMVYPSLLAFVILASYGFFLIYSLSHDMSTMARNINEMTNSIDRLVVDVGDMSANVNKMTLTLNNMNHTITTMSTNVSYMSEEMNNLDSISGTMGTMGRDIQSMVLSTDGIRREMGSMNYNIGRPMKNMTNFFPFLN